MPRHPTDASAGGCARASDRPACPGAGAGGGASDLVWMEAHELGAAYRSRALSPVEVTEAVLARIDALNPALNAFVLVDHDAALADARASEARWSRGEPASPIDGVPTSIKDLILTRGWPTLRGSLTIDPKQAWDADAPVTARLREAGAVLLGKTATPEFGWRGSTDSRLAGITRNPWDLTKTPGGSSGGASAAIAAGLGALAVGTDGGGSIRIPAAFTGTAGLKPHFGRVPAWPASPMGSVAHLGPMTRSARDCALMLREIARPDDRDWTALPPVDVDWSASLDAPLAGLRIAYSPRLGYLKWVDPQVERAVAQAAQVLASLGAKVDQVDPPIADSRHAFAVHWFSAARHLLHRLAPEQFERLDPGLQAVVHDAARYTLADYLDAQHARATLALKMRRFMRDHDLLLTPATAIAAFDAGRVTPVPPAGAPGADNPNDWTWWTPFSFPFNLTQQPAIVVGCGFTDGGLPIGLQLVAPAWREEVCLRAAHAYERATPWRERRPPI